MTRRKTKELECPYCGGKAFTTEDNGEHDYDSMRFGHLCVCGKSFDSVWDGNPDGVFSHFEDENGNHIKMKRKPRCPN